MNVIDDLLDMAGSRISGKSTQGRRKIHVFVPKAVEEQLHREKVDESKVQKLIVGNYKIIKTVGKGRFSSVKLARHLFTGEQVAIKIVEKAELDENELNTLMREVGILKQLNHPNVVRLFEVIITSETIYLVQEYCPGGEFYDYLVPKGKMKEDEAKRMFYQIFSAVKYCHEQMVVHRDLKPENLLLDENMNVKLADFGLSRFYDPMEKCKTFCGSPFYAAPEIFTGTPYTGPEPDMWALGVMVYTVVTGTLPFENASAATEGRYIMDSDLSSDCQNLIRGCLQIDRYRRSNICDVMALDWLREVRGESEGISGTDKKTLLHLDDEILQQMESSGYHAGEIRDSVANDKFNDPYATYMLFRERKIRYPQLHNAELADLMNTMTIKNTSPSPLPKAFVTGDISQEPLKVTTALNQRGGSKFTFNPDLSTDIGTSLDNSIWSLSTAKVSSDMSESVSPNTATIEHSQSTMSMSSSSQAFKFKGPRPKKKYKRTARVSRLSLISRTISYKSAKELFDIVQNALASMRIIHSGDNEHAQHYVLTCVFQSLQWEIEVCRMPMVAIHGLKFKRKTGDPDAYKIIVERIILMVEADL
eukprot:CFRG3855T1